MEEVKDGSAADSGINAGAKAAAAGGGLGSSSDPPSKRRKIEGGSVAELDLSVKSFEELRSKGVPYIDKTRFVAELAKSPKCKAFFRPRRFGKTLLLDTLQCYLERREELFVGLHVHKERLALFRAEQGASAAGDGRQEGHASEEGAAGEEDDTAVTEVDPFWAEDNAVPVLRFDLSKPQATRGILVFEVSLAGQLRVNAERLGVEEDIRRTLEAVEQNRGGTVGVVFQALLRAVKKKHRKCPAVLIDEVDSPISHVLNSNGHEMNEKVGAIRDVLADFMGVCKHSSELMHLVVITGVIKFILSDLFSDINNIYDLTYHRSMAGACGFTEDEIRHAYGAQLDTLAAEERIAGNNVTSSRDAMLSMMKERYGGWCFDGATKVLNTWDVVSSLQSLELDAFWVAEGGTTWLTLLMVADPYLLGLVSAGKAFVPRRGPGQKVDRELFRSLLARKAADRDSVLRVMLQAGFLAVGAFVYKKFKTQMPLRFVNDAVREQLVEVVLPGMLGGLKVSGTMEALRRAIQAHRVAAMVEAVDRAMDAHNTYQQLSGVGDGAEPVAGRNLPERVMQALYSISFGLAGADFQAEPSDRYGRADIVITFGDRKYAIIEFKMVEETAKAKKKATKRNARKGMAEEETAEEGSEGTGDRRLERAIADATAQALEYAQKYYAEDNEADLAAYVVVFERKGGRLRSVEEVKAWASAEGK